METPTEEEKKTSKEEKYQESDISWLLELLLSSVGKVSSVNLIKRAFVLLYSNADEAIPTEQEYNALTAQVEAYAKRRMVSTFLPALLVGLAFYLFSTFSISGEISTKHLIIRVTLSIFFGAVVVWLRELVISEKQQRIRRYELSHAQEEVEEDLFKNSIQISYKYLDQYYAQTRKQAEKGFLITVIVAFSGAILIFGGVGFLLFGDSEKITPAYITCASGAITEFISAVFFYLYNKTVTSMNSYHDKLVLSQNVAFALRIAGEMEGMSEKNKAKLAIINELVKDVNAQMMKSDADTDESPKKDKPADAETTS